jgi:PHD/YefM family antitoxin component YafN of YafNO toxin-antitoxin module
MRTFSTVELLRELPTVIQAVARGPVAITRHRKPRYVLMAMEDYFRLTGAADPQEAYETADLPESVRAELSAGLAANIAELAGNVD